MARLEGSKNNNISAQPVTISLSVEERLEFLANIIVDRIMDDQSDGQKLLEIIGDYVGGSITTT